MNDTRSGSAWTERIIALPIAELVDGDTLRFERWLDAPPGRVWHALTTPEGWRWTAGMSADLAVDGAFELKFDDTQSMEGRITDIEPGRRIVIDWVEVSIDVPSAPPRRHSESELSVELEPDGEGTRLVLTHRHVTREDAPGFGAGWHSHLGQLEALLAGEELSSLSVYNVLLPSYEQLIASNYA